MTKLTRPNLTRGTKLLTAHTHTPPAVIALDLNQAGVGAENLVADKGSFRINLHIPYLANDYAFSTYTCPQPEGRRSAEGEPFSIPFTIPPYQQQFAVDDEDNPVIDQTTPKITLTEFSISFDQRAEPVSIVDFVEPQGPLPLPGPYPADNPTINSTTAYEMDHDEVTAYTLQLSIWEKTATIFNGPAKIERTIFTAPVDTDVMTSTFERSIGGIGNPTIFPDLSIPIDPYKTYGVSIRMPALGTLTDSPNTRNHALVSVQISLKFKSVLVPRDIHNAPMAISNKPTKDTSGAIRDAAVTGISTDINVPPPGSVITADDLTGVNTQMTAIDEAYREKLSGGYTDFSEVAAMQQLADDSTFEVIAVPMFNNRRQGGIYADRWLGFEPYTSLVERDLWERKIIPLSYPFVVHHVILAWNWQRFIAVDLSGGTGIASPWGVARTAMTAEIGVGIGTGLRGDLTGYQQIAHLAINTPTNEGLWETHLIDKISVTRNFSAERGALTEARDWELHQVPLVPDIGAPPTGNGASYYPTSTPAFVGKAWSPTTTRQDMEGGVLPRTFGQEQFLECRMKLGTLPRARFPTDPDSGEIIVGYQGHWIYIIGKKSIT